MSGRLTRQQHLSGRSVGRAAAKAASAGAGRNVAARAKDVKERSVKDVKTGFKWDPAYSRWVRDDKLAGKVDAPVKIQTKSGGEYTIWPVMHSDLMEYGLKSYPPAEVAKMQKQGWTLIDVRVVDNYEKSHIEGAISVPLYRGVQGRELFDQIKRFTMASLAMMATERDPAFADKVSERFGKNAKLIVCDDIGGTLSTKVEVAHKVKTYEVKDPERAFGRESRSLKAAHALVDAGFTNIAHLEGGMQQWRHQGYPMAD